MEFKLLWDLKNKKKTLHSTYLNRYTPCMKIQKKNKAGNTKIK